MKNTLKNRGFLNGCVPSAGSIPAPGTQLTQIKKAEGFFYCHNFITEDHSTTTMERLSDR